MAEPNSADFVVIGSGIIGSLTAHKLAKAGASVLILEAGPRVTRGELVARFRNSPRRSDWMSPYPPAPWAPHPIYQPKDNGYLVQAGPYPYPAEYIRQVGGTTWHWAAHAWRNVPNDFRIHSLYGVGVDWPLTYEDLEPFYQEAEVLMGVSGAPNTGSPRSKPFPMQPVAEPYAMRRIRERLAPAYEVVTNTTARNSRSYDGRPACCGNNSCQPICPIDAQYHGGLAAAAAEAAGVKLLANANVYKLEHDETGRITAALYYDPEKRSHRVTGKTFIVAANGIESPRLLLLSVSDKFPKGLANSSDMVGRNLMDHPSTSLTVEMHRFAKPAHTDDHSVWLLKDEKIAHSPDLLNPDQLPMLGFAVSDTVVYHAANLTEVAALDWTHFVGGHGNVGSKQDFNFQLAFLEDLRQATLKARQEEAFTKYMKPTENSHAAFARSQRDAITKRVTEDLRPKYGQMYGYDASMPYNVELAIRLVGSYY